MCNACLPRGLCAPILKRFWSGPSDAHQLLLLLLPCPNCSRSKEDYVSSSESELGEEDRAFAEDMGLPTGDVDLEDSDHSSDDEGGGGRAAKKAAKAKADAAAAAAAKAAETSWLGGGGGRWGGGGGGGDEQAKGAEEETTKNGTEPTKDVESVMPPGSPAAEVGTGVVEEGEDGRSKAVIAPLEEDGAAPPAGKAGPVVLAGNGEQNGQEHDKNQDGEMDVVC